MVRPWSVVDFALIWLGGLLGGAIGLGVAQAFDAGSWLVLLSLAGQYAGNLGVFAIVRQRKSDSDVGLTVEPGDIRYAGLGILLQIVMALLFLPLSRALFPDGQPPQEIADAISDPAAPASLKLGLFTAAVLLAPLTEELVFRGVLLRSLASRGTRFAILVSGSIFALVHLLGVDPDRFLASAAVVIPPLFILAVILGWLTFRSERLGPAIFLHSGWNLLAAIVFLVPSELLESVG